MNVQLNQAIQRQLASLDWLDKHRQDFIAEYYRFCADKAEVAQGAGFNVRDSDMHPSLFQHQRDSVKWALARGRGLIAAAFGMGKTRMQIEILRQVQERTSRKVLVICPLGVRHQFSEEDGPALGVNFQYVRSDDEIISATTNYLITNYERVRDGNITADCLNEHISGLTLDEGAILGNLGTKTQQNFSAMMKDMRYRWVATATPAPNDYRQLIYFADFLGDMDAGQALTRWFGRNPDKAGDLQLLPHMEEEFWLWVASWALFVTMPSDLGYSDDGYVMPELDIHWHRLTSDHAKAHDMTDSFGQHYLFKDTAAGVTQATREKRDSMEIRVSRMLEIVLQLECEQISNIGDTYGNQDDKTTQSGILRGEQGAGEGAGVEILPREQGQDRQGSTKTLHEGVSENISEISTYTGGIGRKKPKTQGTVRGRSRVQGEGETTSDREQQAQPSDETQWPTEGGIWDNCGGLRSNSENAKRVLRNLQEVGEHRESSAETQILLRGSRSQDNEGAWPSLPKLQLRNRSLSGQFSDFKDGGRISRQFLVWCDLNDEQKMIENVLSSSGISFSSVHGGLTTDDVERRLYEWKHHQTQAFIAKPSMMGVGINMQQSHRAIYLGVGYKFRDFIQSIHRIQRFGQTETVRIDIIHTDAEDNVVRVLQNKWQRHNELVARMRAIIQKYGLTNEALVSGLQRNLGVTRQEKTGNLYTAVNNDTVIEMTKLADNSVGEIVTSIPFGNHYEYVASYNDFGHNPTDDNFWKQMDFLVPNLLRVLKPGRMACIHVKDRLLYGHQTSHGMMEVDAFSDDCVRSFRKHGFVFYGRVTIPTDVVRENSSTNRLGWTENSKDGTKMGTGMPEYVLLFRKPQTDKSRSYADEPVRKDKAGYSRARWQIDAHQLWRSDGKTITPWEDPEVCARMDSGALYRWYTSESPSRPYDYEQHVKFNEAVGESLPATFSILPAQAPPEYEEFVWTDILFMRTLNMENARRRIEKHVCPLPIDIVKRLIVRYSNPGDLVLDPFAGLFTVPYVALKLGRQAYGVELNPVYFDAGCGYCEKAEVEISTPTLFDMDAVSEPDEEAE